MILRNVYLSAIAAILMVPASALHAQTGMREPDGTKPIQITGCMTARTKSGAFVLSGVFGRPVTVIGPNYLQTGLGHQVTLTGTWQTNGISGDAKSGEKMFVATAVKVTSRQCASPPSPPATSDNKSGKAPGGG